MIGCRPMNAPDDLELEAMIEPYRTKVVEKIRLLPRAERAQVLERAFFSLVHVDSADIFIDFMTDSGTSAMSDEQWAGLMRGDESYARSKNFFHFESTVQELTGYSHVIPTHQGRSAENLVMEQLVKAGDLVTGNTLFDTTRAHVVNRKASPLDLVGEWL